MSEVKNVLSIVTLFAMVSGCILATEAVTHNVLTVSEKEAGWRLLFDGKTTEGWRGFQQKNFPTNGWVVDAACLMRNAKGGDLVTKETFLDFELSWEWKIVEKGNSGIKYLVDEARLDKKNGKVSKNALGNEYQMLDDGKYPELGRKFLTASWYSALEAKGASPKPIGEFNLSKIIVNGNHCEHWLNGVKVLEYELGSPVTAELIAKSNFKNVPGYAEKRRTPILLQDHGRDVWFRNIKIRELKQ